MRHFQSLDYRAATVDDDDSLLDTVHQNTITYVHLCRRASEHYHVCSLVSLCIRTLSSMFTCVVVHQNTITYVHLCHCASEHYHVCSLVSSCIRTLSRMFTCVTVHQNTIKYVHLCHCASEHYQVCSLLYLCCYFDHTRTHTWAILM